MDTSVTNEVSMAGMAVQRAIFGPPFYGNT